jgi:dihydrofolate reductase
LIGLQRSAADLDASVSEVATWLDTLLYGRAAWEGMAVYWPQAETDPARPTAARDLACFLNGARKIVFSRTLQDAGRWSDSEIADVDVGVVVAREKT